VSERLHDLIPILFLQYNCHNCQLD